MTLGKENPGGWLVAAVGALVAVAGTGYLFLYSEVAGLEEFHKNEVEINRTHEAALSAINTTLGAIATSLQKEADSNETLAKTVDSMQRKLDRFEDVLAPMRPPGGR
jgi:hypothetical protein